MFFSLVFFRRSGTWPHVFDTRGLNQPILLSIHLWSSLAGYCVCRSPSLLWLLRTGRHIGKTIIRRSFFWYIEIIVRLAQDLLPSTWCELHLSQGENLGRLTWSYTRAKIRAVGRWLIFTILWRLGYHRFRIVLLDLQHLSVRRDISSKGLMMHAFSICSTIDTSIIIRTCDQSFVVIKVVHLTNWWLSCT
jgi:hypothetical protein